MMTVALTSAVSSTSVYRGLLDYFQSPAAQQPRAIAHPDTTVNALSPEKSASFRKAAVLIPVTRLCDGESHLVLTVRSANLKHHAGQISLPGGSTEPEDNDAVATALRESEEEIGLEPNQVEILGQLGELIMPSGFRITPIVGLINNDLVFRACPEEVADVFQVPLALVLDPVSYRQSSYHYGDTERVVLELHYEDYRIWGATAAILHHLALSVHVQDNQV
ncbi:MAG: CoA pyrophosphatase [Gammaproteobacteria bacterium]|nr:CoA pyrophosphatase [Gammaproteobacteria bacterium]